MLFLIFWKSDVFFNGFVRDVPRIVPPLGRIPDTEKSVSGSTSPSMRPCHPFRIPSVSKSYFIPALSTARITALSPGQSPPPVRTPMVFIALSLFVFMVSCYGISSLPYPCRHCPRLSQRLHFASGLPLLRISGEYSCPWHFLQLPRYGSGHGVQRAHRAGV